MIKGLTGLAALTMALWSGTALASDVVQVPHGVVVTPDSGPAKRVRVLAYGDAAFRVTAVPVETVEVPDSLMVTARPEGQPAVSTARGIVTLKLPVEARPVDRTLADRGILAGVSLGRLYPGVGELANGLVVAVTETTTPEDVETLSYRLEEVLAA